MKLTMLMAVACVGLVGCAGMQKEARKVAAQQAGVWIDAHYEDTVGKYCAGALASKEALKAGIQAEILQEPKK